MSNSKVAGEKLAVPLVAPVPLLLIAGTLCDARLFAPLLGCLDLGERAVIDGRFEGAHSIADAADMLLEQAPPVMAVLGFSLGGLVALAMARSRPDRIAGLALLNSTARGVDRALHPQRRDEVEQAHARGAAAFAAESLLPRYGLADAAPCRSLILKMADDAGAERLACETEIALSRPDFRPLLSALAMPALVVGGDRDPINPPVVQAEMAATLPHAALAMIADSGHFTPLEQPAALAPHVADWLARVDQAHHRHQEERQ